MNRTRNALAALLCLAGSAVSAQTITIGTANVSVGATTAQIPVTFATGANAVGSYSVSFTFTRADPVAASGMVTVTAGDGTCGGPGVTTATGTQINLADFDAGGGALAAGTVCTLTFPLEPGAAAGNYPFTVGFTEFTDPGGGTTTGTVVPGGINISAVGNVPPTLTYMPNFGTTVVFPNGAPLTVTNATIAVSGAGGSGSGLDATARVTNCAVSSSFSPPGITCQAGTTGTLDFTPGGADPGDINCSCVVPAVGTENAQLSCEEISPASGSPVVRIWDLTCSGGTCGTLAFNPPLGAVNFTGGAASITVSHTGGTAGTDTTFNSCIVSGANAANFAITNSPINFNFPGGQSNQGTISLSCNNSTTTDVTATLSCNQICDGTTARTWTLNCPGQTVVPPDAEVVPVPTLGDLGRILMAAMLLLLGMGAVTIRNRG